MKKINNGLLQISTESVILIVKNITKPMLLTNITQSRCTNIRIREISDLLKTIVFFTV